MKWVLQPYYYSSAAPSLPQANLLVAFLLRERRENWFYKFAFSKLAYLILPESSDLLDSGGEHKTDCQINDALKCPPAAPSLLAGGCYLCLNDIIAFPPAQVLPNGKTCIKRFERIRRAAVNPIFTSFAARQNSGRTYSRLSD